ADQFPAERLQIEEEVVSMADLILAECPQDKEDLIRYYHANGEKIEIIPCGFSPEEFYPMSKTWARRFLKLSSQEKIILQLGRMVPRKGVNNVIRSVALAKEKISQIRLV